MVIKPLSFIARGRKGIVQPGVKCRGREYLRIIYGPEYIDPTQLHRLRGRGLGRKRGLAVREFGLGVEALERFVRREPLYQVHECVFAVLALESEPVDPRLCGNVALVGVPRRAWRRTLVWLDGHPTALVAVLLALGLGIILTPAARRSPAGSL